MEGGMITGSSTKRISYLINFKKRNYDNVDRFNVHGYIMKLLFYGNPCIHIYMYLLRTI